MLVRGFAVDKGINEDSIHVILGEGLEFCVVLNKFLSKFFSQEQREIWFDSAQNILESLKEDAEFLNSLITGDETRVNGVGLRYQSSVITEDSFNFCRSKKKKKNQGNCDYFLFDSHAFVHLEYSPEIQTVLQY